MGWATLITKELANVPMRRGPTNGIIHVAIMRKQKSQLESVNQMKKCLSSHNHLKLRVK